MDPNDLHEELDDAFWFSDGITALYKKGVKEPIYDILNTLKRDDKFCKEQLERNVEQAIFIMVDQFNAQEKAQFKQRLADAIRGHIIVQILTGEVYRTDARPIFHYNLTCQQTFTNEQDASEFLHKKFKEFNINHTMEECRDFAQRTVFDTFFEDGKYNVKIFREHVFL